MSVKFPKTIFVTHDSNADDDEYNDLLAWPEQGDGVEGDGPTTVATYALVETAVVSKKLCVDKKATL